MVQNRKVTVLNSQTSLSTKPQPDFSNPTIPIDFVGQMLEGAVSRNLNCQPLLHEVGLPGLAVDRMGLRISIQRYAQLMILVREALQDEFLGFLDHPNQYRRQSLPCDWKNNLPVGGD